MHFSTLGCEQQDRRVMQILICLTGKPVKFPCFSAINSQITCVLPFALTSSLSVRTFCVRISTRSFRELLSLCGINDVRVEEREKTIEIMLSRVTPLKDQEGVNTKYPRGSYSRQASRGFDLDFPTRHYIISALSSGEYGENDQLVDRSERARFSNGRRVDVYQIHVHVIRFAQLS